MVFFVCEGCNESMKKNQVDKHASRCRSCHAVTCVDCQVTFYGNDYAAHTVCVSEAEKYEKTLYKGPKVKANPQDAWMVTVMEAVESFSQAPHPIQAHLKRLGELNNIPRNHKKFINFIKNSLRLHNDNLINDMFKYLESFKPTPASTPASSTTTPSSSSTNVSKNVTETSNDKVEKKKKDKKEKHKDDKTIACEDIIEIDTNGTDTILEESKQINTEKKSKKKDKHKRSRDDQNDEEEIELNTEMAATIINESEIEEIDKKKKKKRKKDRQDACEEEE